MVGVALPISTTWGQQSQRGVELGVKEVNASGGINGRPIKLITYDTQAKPEEAVQVVERLITRDNVKVLIGPDFSGETLASMPVVNRYNIVQFAIGSKTDAILEKGNPRTFFFNSTVSMDTINYAKYVTEQLKPKSIVIITEQSDLAHAALNIVQGMWSGPNAPNILSVEKIDPRESDLSPVLTKVKGMKPDAIYVLISQAEHISKLLKQGRELGLQSTILAGPGMISATVVPLAGAAIEGIKFGDFYFSSQPNPENLAFVEKFQKEYGNKPDKLELCGYEAVIILAQSLRKTGADASPDELAKEIQESSFTTPRGSFKFVKLGKSYQAPSSFLLLQVKDGQIVLANQ